MLRLNSDIHLERARSIEDSGSAILEYMRAIEEAVKELKQPRPAARAWRGG